MYILLNSYVFFFRFFLGHRVQINSLTSYIDANFVYGSNIKKANSLREFRGGLMKTVDIFKNFGLKPLLPPKVEQPNDGCIRSTSGRYCFSAGKLIRIKHIFTNIYNSNYALN